MQAQYVLIFILLFNGMVPVGNDLVHAFGAPNTLTSNQSINYTMIQQGGGCVQNQSSTKGVGTCTSVLPNSNVISLAGASFGDYLDAIPKYVATFAVGMFLPFWFLTSFGIDPALVAAINIVVWVGYVTLILYFLSNRNPEV